MATNKTTITSKLSGILAPNAMSTIELLNAYAKYIEEHAIQGEQGIAGKDGTNGTKFLVATNEVDFTNKIENEMSNDDLIMTASSFFPNQAYVTQIGDIYKFVEKTEFPPANWVIKVANIRGEQGVQGQAGNNGLDALVTRVSKYETQAEYLFQRKDFNRQPVYGDYFNCVLNDQDDNFWGIGQFVVSEIQDNIITADLLRKDPLPTQKAEKQFKWQSYTLNNPTIQEVINRVLTFNENMKRTINGLFNDTSSGIANTGELNIKTVNQSTLYSEIKIDMEDNSLYFQSLELSVSTGGGLITVNSILKNVDSSITFNNARTIITGIDSVTISGWVEVN